MKAIMKIIAGLSTLSLMSCATFYGSDVNFTKRADVFGVTVLAASDVPDDKLQHAVNVMAQYLDNDEDGVPDNPALVSTMVGNKATLVMVKNERDIDRVNIDDLDININFAQVLYASETHPDGASQQVFDATLEEVLHLISTSGYAQLYPTVFGTDENSQQSAAMDIARGGKFKEIPKHYPEDAWYRYYDHTCDYHCQGDEYFYWSLTTLLGAQDYPWRKQQIADEWSLSTAAAFKKTDRAMYRLLTNPRYKLPTKLPNGRYKGRSLDIKHSTFPADLDTSVSANGIIPLPDEVPSAYREIFSQYTEVVAPNGKPIRVLADKGWSEEKIIKARNVLEHFLTDAPGSRFGSDKSEIANSMANEEAVLILFTDWTAANNAFEKLVSQGMTNIQNLHANEITVEGTQDYLNHRTRDASYEEILHFVHVFGIQPTIPEYHLEITKAEEAATARGFQGWPKSMPENWPHEYFAAIYDVYMDLWKTNPAIYEGESTEGRFPPGTTHFGSYPLATDRESFEANDPKGYKVLQMFFQPYLTYTPVLPEDFSGTFSLQEQPGKVYTQKAKHLVNVKLSGSLDANLLGNAYDNTFSGNAGDNRVDGAAGHDVMVYPKPARFYKITKKGARTLIVRGDGKDTLVNIETLRFAGQDVSVKKLLG